jgi:hypothetical protein
MNARDAAVAELVNVLHIEPGDAAAIVDRIVTAAALESGARLAEAALEPLAIMLRKNADAAIALLGRAHRELVGEVPPRE